MSRSIAISVLLGLLAGLASNVANAWDRAAPSDVMSMAAGGIVKIDVFGDPDSKLVGHGSGFVITPDGFVETAAHLFPTGSPAKLIEGRLANVLSRDDDKDNTFQLNLIDINIGLDVALLKFVGVPKGIRALPISLHKLQTGDTLALFGFPGGQNTYTVYPATFESQKTPHRFQFQGIANVGNSGGPLLDQDGFVVGLDSHRDDVIQGSRVAGTYEGVPAADFILPKAFDAAKIRPLFFRTDNRNDPLVTARYPAWTSDAINAAIDGFTSERQPRACNMSLNPQWRMRKLKLDIGFVIAPPDGSLLESIKFQMSLSVQRIPNYLRAVGAQIASHKYVPIPYNILPLEDESILLMNPSVSGEQPDLKNVALQLRVVDGRLLIVRYLRRQFGKYDYHPADVDSEMAICTMKQAAPVSLLLALCEPFMKQTVNDYLTIDNPCIPGTPVRSR